MSVFTVIFLGVCTITDLKKKQIWWPFAVLFMTAAMTVHFVRGEENLWIFPAGMALGAFLCLVSWVTREAIGYGDGLTVAACGAALGIEKAFHLLILSLCFSAAWSAILLIFRKAKRKDCFPFVPFLLAAQLCILIF